MPRTPITVKVSVKDLPAFAALQNRSFAQQLVIEGLYAVVRAKEIGSLALRLRAEQRLRAAEADLQRANDALDAVLVRHEVEPDLCPDAQDYADASEYEDAVREWDERDSKRGGNLGRTESLAEEMMP